MQFTPVRMRIIKYDSEDHKLIIGIKKSDPAAYKQLYYKYSDPIFGFIYKNIREQELSRDLTQTIFMKLWENRSRLDSEKSIKSYLYKAANNRIIDHYRAKKTLTTSDPAELEQGYEFNYDNSFLKDEIHKAVNTLPQMQKNVFSLSRFEELSYREISETLNISERTVETHLRRAVIKLRELLSHLKIILFLFLINV